MTTQRAASTSAFGELDIWLARAGRHEQLYEKLGAHPVENGVRFAVWAPNAHYVGVVGDFNDWDPAASPLQPVQETGIWEGVVEQLRRPVGIDPAIDGRVLREIAADARPEAAIRSRPRAPWGWLAAAAVLAVLVVARPWHRGGAPGLAPFQFVLVAPQAASVSLVGDFNDWDPARARLQAAHGVWTTVIQLPPGRYRYAFLVNGVEWRADPSAPHAADDEFGTQSSVVTVTGSGS